MHNIHLFNILTTDSSFNKHKFKRQNLSLFACNLLTLLLEAEKNIFFNQQLSSYRRIQPMLISMLVTNKSICQIHSTLERLNLKSKD